MRKSIIVIFLTALILMMPVLASAEEITDIEVITSAPEPTIEPTPEPVAVTETIEPTPEPVVAGASSLISPEPCYYEYDDTTIIGSLAAFLGIGQGAETPQTLGEAIPYILGIALIMGVLWFIYAMLRGFTGSNIFGKARNGGR